MAGLEFAAAARRIIEDVDAEFRRLRKRGRGEQGLLTIGLHASPSTGNMHASLVEFHRRYPDVEVHTVDGSRDQLLFRLTSNAVDIAILTGRETDWDDRTLPLWSERVIAALPHNHALAGSRRIGWAELADQNFLLPQRGPGPELEDLLTAKLRHVLDPQKVVHQDSSLDRLLSMVSADYGVLLMFEGATGVRRDGVVYREICDNDSPTRAPFMACWRAANGNPALASFLAMLRHRYPDLAADASELEQRH